MTTTLPRSSTIIHQNWRLPVRIAWLILATGCIILFIVGTIDVIRSPLPSCTGAEADCIFNTAVTQEDVVIAAEMGLSLPLLPLSLFFSVLAQLSLALVGLIIFWRKSDDWVALFLAGALMTTLLEGVVLRGYLLNLTNFFFAIGIGLFFFLPFVFPNGRFVPHQFRWIIIIITVIYSLGYLFFVESPEFSIVSAVITLIWVILSFIAIPYRFFRVSNAIERQQTKWISIGILTVMITASFYTFYVTVYPPSQPSQTRIVLALINLPVYALGYSFFGFSILMAIIRNRLWDVDIIIRRTLQYVLLSSILALIYFGSVVLAQTVVNGVSGRTESSQLTIALSTLLIAALFNPIRRRVQAFINRRFFRRSYNAQQVLARFALTARDQVELEQLTQSIHYSIEEALQPATVSIWLEKAEPKRDRKMVRNG